MVFAGTDLVNIKLVQDTLPCVYRVLRIKSYYEHSPNSFLFRPKESKGQKGSHRISQFSNFLKIYICGQSVYSLISTVGHDLPSAFIGGIYFLSRL